MFVTSFIVMHLVSAQTEWDDHFTYSTDLGQNQQFRLYWSHLDNDVIDFGIEANSTGWIAIGLSPNGGMEHSDIMLGWVDDVNGSVVVQDRYTGGSQSTPILDDVDHLTLIEGEQKDGITRIRFQRTRSLDCNDTSGHDMAVTQGTSRVIYAWNDNDGDINDPNSIDYHGATQRGTQSVNLWYGEGHDHEVQLEDDVDYFDLTVSNWSVAPMETEYACKLFEIPTFNATQHVVMFDPLIGDLVHHMTVFVCPEDWVYVDTVNDSHQMRCEDWDTRISRDCRGYRLTAAWAVGGGAQRYPEEAGLPIGGDSDFRYAFMSVHYDVEC